MKRREVVNWKKRALSVVLTIGMVVGMVPFADFGERTNVKAADSSTITSKFEYSYVNNNTGKAYSRVRGVVDKLKDLPDQGYTKIDAWDSWLACWQTAQRGTPERPFLILEVVPYRELASIGYTVSGCEPVDMQKVAASNVKDSYYTSSLYSWITPGDWTNPSEKAYFFKDEREGKRTFYFKQEKVGDDYVSSDKFSESEWEGKKVTTLVTDSYKKGSKTVEGVCGYYEIIANENEGTFKYDYDETTGIVTITTVKQEEGEKGNVVWHTLNSCCRNDVTNLDKNYKGFVTDLATTSLKEIYRFSEVGDRIYAMRKNSEEDPCYDVTGAYTYFKSNDVFCKDVLNLSEQDAANYSIVVKTITPDELNTVKDGIDGSKWIDVADLIFFNCYLNNEPWIDLWKVKDNTSNYVNRFNKEDCGIDLRTCGDRSKYETFYGVYPDDVSEEYRGKHRDIKWNVAEKIISRVASAKNYVGLVIDKGVVTNYIKPYGKDRVQYGRYKLDGTRVGTDYFEQQGFDNNVYKLWITCTSINPNIVKKYYIDAVPKRITTDSTGFVSSIVGRSGDEATYWSGATFYAGAEVWPDTWMQNLSTAQHQQYWEAFEGNINIDLYNQFVNGHLYTTCEGDPMYLGLESGSSCLESPTSDAHFQDFNEYIDNNTGTREIYKRINGKDDTYYDENVNGSKISSWAALRYILDIDKDNNPYYEKVRVLDIEPSVGLQLSNKSKPDWKLNKETVKELLPLYCAYDTEVEVTNMLMVEFVGKLMDLNSEYDLVYLGENAEGFWTGAEIKAVSVGWKNATKTKEGIGQDRTDFFDDEMDGLVYFHQGDVIYAGDMYSNWEMSKGVKYSDQAREFLDKNLEPKTPTWNGIVSVRQPGNDLTVAKKEYFYTYLKGNYPILVADHLFDSSYVDRESVLYAFLQDGSIQDKLFKENSVKYMSDSTLEKQLRKALRKSIVIDDSECPQYDYKVTQNETPEDLANNINNIKNKTEYLPKLNGLSVVMFDITVPAIEDYCYRIYFDKNKNSKFGDVPLEIQKEDDLKNAYKINGNTATVYANVPNSWAGFIHWRIEVYDKSNEARRSSKEGCSICDLKSGKMKQIVALQIIPDEFTGSIRDDKGHFTGYVGMRKKIDGINTFLNDDSWTNLYRIVREQGIFDISVEICTWTEFNNVFKAAYEKTGKKFSFNMGKPIGKVKDEDGNVVMEDGKEKKNPDDEDYTSALYNIQNTKLGSHLVKEYNMLIIGFGDGYGITDLSNYYGAAEYIYYFAEDDNDDGGSVLLTHDLDSYYTESKAKSNVNSGPNDRAFGYTVNSMMRDLSGLNRYGVYSTELNNDTTYFREGLLDDITDYRNGLQMVKVEDQAKKKIVYDYATKNEQQGYTLWGALHRICNYTNFGNEKGIYNYTGKSQYKYIVKYLDRGKDAYYSQQSGGVTHDLNLTTCVGQLNKGQITEYPFKIDETIRVARTHAQYHELNIAEPGVTVWYTLEGTKPNGYSDYQGMGESGFAAALPHYASNNYYIYSKGNIFYSGVGHWEISTQKDGLAERELFVNTMVAAYRPKSDKPHIDVTYSTAETKVEGSSPNFTLRFDKEMDYGTDGNLIDNVKRDDLGHVIPDIVMIPFIPRDNNNQDYVYVKVCFENDKDKNRNMQIYDLDGTPLTPLDKSTDSDLTEDNTFYLKVGKEYAIKYDKNNITTDNAVIYFFTEDETCRRKPFKDTLEILPGPMFNLG